MANEWGAAPRRKVNHGSPYRCKGGIRGEEGGGVTRGCPFGSLDYMGVSRSRMQRTPDSAAPSGRFWGPNLPPPSVHFSFPLPRGPYGAVCFVRLRAPLENNYEHADGAYRHGWSPWNYCDYSGRVDDRIGSPESNEIMKPTGFPSTPSVYQRFRVFLSFVNESL